MSYKIKDADGNFLYFETSGGDGTVGNPFKVASAASLPLPAGAATAVNQATELTQLGGLTETAPGTDTASSGLNGRLQRVAQNLTSVLVKLNASVAVTGTFWQTTQPVSAASLPLPTGAATSAQIGEVQTTPTANTVLDRLKALLTGISLAAGGSVIGKVGIDQTTDGTTNLVVTKNRITTVSNGSGTITSGGTAQTAIASDAAGYNYLIQNNSPTELWFSTLATAIIGQPSLRLAPNESYETPDSLKAVGALSVIGATTGQPFSVRKW